MESPQKLPPHCLFFRPGDGCLKISLLLELPYAFISRSNHLQNLPQCCKPPVGLPGSEHVSKVCWQRGARIMSVLAHGRQIATHTNHVLDEAWMKPRASEFIVTCSPSEFDKITQPARFWCATKKNPMCQTWRQYMFLSEGCGQPALT